MDKQPPVLVPPVLVVAPACRTRERSPIREVPWSQGYFLDT